MNIDFHFHHLPEFFVSELRSENPWRKRVEGDAEDTTLHVGPVQIPLPPPHWDVTATLQQMDRLGIDVAAVSPSPLLFHSEWPAAPVISLHQRVNDHLAELRRAHPGRFAPLAALPMQDPAAAVKELERCRALGLAGAEIETHIAGRPLDAPEFRPVFAAAAETGAVLFLHPLAVLGMERLRRFYLSNLLGNPSDTAAAIASLIFGGVLDEFPDLKIVCAHGGGSAPCLCGRWDHGWRVRPEIQSLPRAPSEYLRGLYFDSLTHSSQALDLLVSVVGSDRIVLGSDYPYDMGNENAVADVRRASGLEPHEIENILGGTAAQLLGMTELGNSA